MTETEDRRIGIVVEEGSLRPPHHAHGMTGAEHHVDNCAQASRPCFSSPERCRRPIMIPDHLDQPRGDNSLANVSAHPRHARAVVYPFLRLLAHARGSDKLRGRARPSPFMRATSRRRTSHSADHCPNAAGPLSTKPGRSCGGGALRLGQAFLRLRLLRIPAAKQWIPSAAPRP